MTKAYPSRDFLDRPAAMRCPLCGTHGLSDPISELRTRAGVRRLCVCNVCGAVVPINAEGAGNAATADAARALLEPPSIEDVDEIAREALAWRREGEDALAIVLWGGDGLWSATFEGLGARTVCVEPDPALATRAKARLGDTSVVVREEAIERIFEDDELAGSADVVVVGERLCLSAAPFAALSGALRLVRGGGVLVVRTPAVAPGGLEAGARFFLTETGLASLASRLGLRIQSQRRSTADGAISGVLQRGDFAPNDVLELSNGARVALDAVRTSKIAGEMLQQSIEQLAASRDADGGSRSLATLAATPHELNLTIAMRDASITARDRWISELKDDIARLAALTADLRRVNAQLSTASDRAAAECGELKTRLARALSDLETAKAVHAEAEAELAQLVAQEAARQAAANAAWWRRLLRLLLRRVRPRAF